MTNSASAAASVTSRTSSHTQVLSADEFCDRYANRVYQFARMIARNDVEADDLAQAALERVLKRLPQFDWSRGDASGWLWRVVVNVAADAGRSARRRHLLVQRLIAFRGQLKTVEIGIPQGIDDDRLLAAVRTLTSLQRAVIALRFGADLDYAAIAQALNISAGAATKCGSRALASLRAQLVEDHQ